MQSWISVYEGSKGGGREASLRSHQHYTQVPEGVAPTQLSTPITMAWLCPGHPCLTALFHFSHGSFLSHTGRSRAILLSHVTHTLTQKGKEFIHSFLFVHFFPHSFHFHFLLVFVHCSPSANPQKPNSATKNPLLSFKCPLLLNNSFLLPSHKHIPHFPFFYSSFVHLQLCCPLSYSRNR